MKLLRDYSLSIVLFLLFAFSWGGQSYFQWRQYVSEADAHNQPVQMTEYIDEFMQATFENWQSEFLQLLSFVVLATYLIHKGSPQSKDGDDEMKKMLQDIQKKLDKKPKK